MNETFFIELVKQVGFNGTLVCVLLFFGYKFLGQLLNHISGIQKEMEKHTGILSQLLEATREGKS